MPSIRVESIEALFAQFRQQVSETATYLAAEAIAITTAVHEALAEQADDNEE